jgi:outer membrane protein OmpA-like peptidoglycan-associated protein
MEIRYSSRITLLAVSLVLALGTLLPVSGYGALAPGQKRTIAANEESTLKGVILSRAGETFVLRDLSRNDTVVLLTDTTKIRTERKGLFRGRKPFDVTVLVPGLILEAEGTGDSEGRLVAKVIEFSETDLKSAITASVRSAQVEKDVSERISSLDEYDLVKTVTVLFPVNKATLGSKQKADLDELAAKAPSAKNYMVEVQGFADPSGNFEKNLDLSQRRAEAVVQYLTVKHNIPLRRISVPMGYGSTKPVGDVKTAAGRADDRRVEVRVLVNKGLSE